MADRDVIISLVRAGYRQRDIAEALCLRYSTVGSVIRRARECGALPAPSKNRTYPQRLGSMRKDFWSNLNAAEREWVRRNTPEDGVAADLFILLVRDAMDEDG